MRGAECTHDETDQLNLSAGRDVDGAATGNVDYSLNVVQKSDEFSTSVVKSNADDVDFLKPLLFPSRTTHRRMIPKGSEHAFAYPYFLVGVPVLYLPRSRSETGVHDEDDNRSLVWKWRSLSVHASDYLARGSGHQDGLRGKLDEYLITQHAKLESYPYAYLVTAPRFWGYSFNPISFWYLYGSDRRLKAMIMEVNNTFDERRCYFLNGAGSNDGRFKQEWTKDFHVSPFNDRMGSYSASVLDPFPHRENGVKGESRADYRLDNTIVLKDPEGVAKLVTRIFSASSPLDPAALTWWQATLFRARWAWIGLLTDVRILKEARNLWMVKKLSVFYRPEPRATSIGRKAIEEEVQIEAVFRQWLQQVADAGRVSFQYTAAAGEACGKNVEIHPSDDVTVGKTGDQEQVVGMIIQVLTPELYRQLVRTSDILPVLTKESSGVEDDQTTVVVSDSLALTTAVEAKFDDRPQADIPNTWRWRIVQLLRTPKSLGLVLFETAVRMLGFPGFVDTTLEMSRLDKIAFAVPSSRGSSLAWEESVLSILLADRLVFGSVRLLRFLAAMVQLALFVVVLVVGTRWLTA